MDNTGKGWLKLQYNLFWNTIFKVIFYNIKYTIFKFTIHNTWAFKLILILHHQGRQGTNK